MLRGHGSGMDALVTACSWNANELGFGHGCCGTPYALGARTEH